VADGRDGLVLFEEVPHDIEQAVVEPEILRRPPTRDHERVVRVGLDLLEIRVQREIVPALLAVRLISFEVVDGRAHLLTGLLPRTDGVHRMADGLERLEGDHHLVVLGEVADEHQDLL